MTDRIWDETEDQVILQIQQLFYYGNGDIFTQIQAILSTISEEQRLELFESVISQIRYEQAERRRFICEQYLFNADGLNRLQQEEFVKSLYSIGLNQTLSPAIIAGLSAAPSGQLKQTTMTQEILDQISTYRKVDENVVSYFQRKNSLELVAPYYTVLKKTSRDQRLALYGGIEQFFSGLSAYGNNPPFDHIVIPNGLVKSLELLGLSGPLERFEMFNEQVSYLVRIKRIIEAIDAVENKQVSEEDAIAATGLYLHQYGA